MSFDNNIPTRFPKLGFKSVSGEMLLAKERAKCTFDVNELSKFMYTEEWLKKMNEILKILESEPAFDKTSRYYQNRKEKISAALWKDMRLTEMTKEYQWDETDLLIVKFLFDQMTPLALQQSLFIPTLKNQTTEEQKKQFLTPAIKHEIIGCYAQTELGHGSNVQGLETTATYIPDTQEFEIHSPTLTSSKWWIGAIGKTATHAIVMARLITQGKDFGPHPFCIPIRSLEDHRPFKGVTVGDIGPKFGFNAVDNGFVLFDHYRVPHISFLAKYSQVDKYTGKFTKPPNSKLSYGTMVHTRAVIVMNVRFALAKAATIAIRYSAVRQQFVDKADPQKWDNEVIETPILNYTMQQYRLLPVVASAYACFFTGREMFRLYNLNQEAMSQDCRRACGGHGYSLFSGLGQFYQDYLPNATWEGDNYILTQQTARYLLKTFRSVAAGKAEISEHNQTITYLAQFMECPKLQCPATKPSDFLNPELILSAFGFRAAYGIAQTVKELDHQGRSWNSMLVEINRISKAHCQFILIRNFLIALQNDALLRQQESTHCVLYLVAYLFALYMMEKELSEFFVTGYLSSEQSQMLKKEVIELLGKIRVDAVSLVDAFALPDYYLHSALGRYDGKVYESMTEMAEREPLNHSVVIDGYEEYIQPLVKQSQCKPASKL
ncbi:unnamed protein product [Rhizopus stolonifer]